MKGMKSIWATGNASAQSDLKLYDVSISRRYDSLSELHARLSWYVHKYTIFFHNIYAMR